MKIDLASKTINLVKQATIKFQENIDNKTNLITFK